MARPSAASEARPPGSIRALPHPAIPPASQLALDLPLGEPALPVLSIAPEWKQQQRLWGHSYHPMCSYLASFPAALTHAFIAFHEAWHEELLRQRRQHHSPFLAVFDHLVVIVEINHLDDGAGVVYRFFLVPVALVAAYRDIGEDVALFGEL